MKSGRCCNQERCGGDGFSAALQHWSSCMRDVANRLPKRKRDTEVRIYCRNERCRLKLPEQRENPHSALCCKGCFEQFYKRKCIVCESEIERTANNRLLCKRSRCRNELRNWPDKYRPFRRLKPPPRGYYPSAPSDPQEVPISCGSKRPSFGIEQALLANRCRIRAPRCVLEAEFHRAPLMEVAS